MSYLTNADRLRWEPHPSGAPGISMKKFRGSADGAAESIALVRIAPGAIVAPHVHEVSDDNLYILAGRATMRVAGETFPIAPGDQITVPMNTEHEIFDVTEELIVYDVFAPPAW